MTARICGRTELTLADQYAAIYWAAPRGFRIGVVTLVAGCIAVAAFELVSPRPNLTIIALLALFLIGCIGMVAVIHWRMSAEQRRVDYLIDHERVVIRDGTGMALMTPWTKVVAIEDHRSGLVLKQQRGGRWLVKRAFAPDDLVALKAMK